MEISFETYPYNHSSLPIFVDKGNFYANTIVSTRTNWHKGIEFVKILSGSLTYSINGKTIKIFEGQALFVNSNQVHRSFVGEYNDCEFICIIFQPSLLCTYKRYEEKYVLPIISNNDIPYYIFKNDVEWENEVVNQIQTIYDISFEKDFELLLPTVFYNMWSNIYRNLHNSQNTVSFENEYMDSFKEMSFFISQHFNEKISLEDIYRAGNIGKTTCSKIFKLYTGRTPIEYLTDYRLSKSIEFMKTGNKTLNEICYECGFSEPSYYAKIFKQTFGIPPKKYRLYEILKEPIPEKYRK